jgi:regulator of sigma E protease
MLSLAIFILVLSCLVIVHEFGHFILAKKSGVRVEKFALGFGPQIFAFQGKETQYSLRAIPLGGYVKLAGDNLEEFKGKPDEYLSQPAFKRLGIIFFGPLLNYVMGFLLFWLIFFAGYPTLTTRVGGLVKGLGAEEAGIRAGDRIIAVEGKKTAYWEDLQKAVQSNSAKPEVAVALLRNNQQQTLMVRIQKKPLEDVLGQRRNVGLIGIKPDTKEIVKVRHGLGESFILGIKKTLELTGLTYKALWLMSTRQMSIRESVTGPLGMFVITSEVTKLGIIALLHFVAVLSISLGIFNLLPLPALDGGHIILLAVEKARGKYLSKKAEEAFSQAGFGFIIFLAVLVFANDLVKYGFIDKLAKFLVR